MQTDHNHGRDADGRPKPPALAESIAMARRTLEPNPVTQWTVNGMTIVQMSADELRVLIDAAELLGCDHCGGSGEQLIHDGNKCYLRDCANGCAGKRKELGL